MSSVWQYSVPVDRDVASSTGCFTSLPIRIHHRNDIADNATRDSVRDWEAHVGDGWEKKSGSSWSPVGNWGAFIFPESLPERLGIITYLANMGNIHDDLCDDLAYDDAVKEHQDLSQAMRVDNAEQVKHAKSSDRSKRMKKYISECVLKAIEIDRPAALRMIDSYRSRWLDVMERQDVNDICDLEAYLEFRNLNGGMEAFWSMVEFGMAIAVSERDKDRIRPIFQAAETALVLTNDYWSWDREWRQALVTKNTRIVNAVHLFMRTKGMTVDGAKEAVRHQILVNEAAFTRLKNEFMDRHPDISPELRKYVEVCGVIVAGNHYWCANCPRHHAWRFNQEHQEDERASTEPMEADEVSCDSDLSPTAFNLSPVSGETPASTDNGVCDHHEDEKLGRTERGQGARQGDRVLLAPITYICSMPSKGLRSLLIEALDLWLVVDSQSLANIKKVIDLLHNSSLILDDIEDCSLLRRGLPATHVVYGQSQAINSANYMFVQAVQHATTFRNPSCLSALLEELHVLFVGQSWDLYWKFQARIPTEEDYIHMVDSKTGAMFKLLARLMLLESSHAHNQEAVQALNTMCVLTGRFFQIRDDLMNLTNDEYSAQKGFAEDLDEGKISYPLLVASQNPGYRDQILGIFQQKRNSTDHTRLPIQTKKYLIKLIESSGAMASTLEKLRYLEKEVRISLRRLEDVFEESNPCMKILLDRLSVSDVTL